MVSFLRHEPCPKCNSRDNLGVWDDGHKWCFGCGFYQPSLRTIKNSRIEEEEKPRADSIDLSACTDIIPEKPLKWLKQYGITNDEIRHYCKGFTEQDYLSFEIVPGFFVGRYFGSRRLPRYMVMGTRPQRGIYIGSKTKILIFVEDIISAIKIGRSFSASPVLGSHISLEAFKWASEEFPEVGIWLDSDMVRKSARMAQKGRFLTGSKVFRIHTKLDPKCYSDEEIQNIVEKARN